VRHRAHPGIRATGAYLPFKLAGNGEPTAVFEAGAGEELDTWDKVLPAPRARQA